MKLYFVSRYTRSYISGILIYTFSRAPCRRQCSVYKCYFIDRLLSSAGTEVECIDVCISYHPVPTRYMSVFKHTETRHISCGTRMSTYAEPDVDSVDWSKGSVKEWLFHETPLHLTKRTGLRNTFERNFRPCVPIW